MVTVNNYNLSAPRMWGGCVCGGVGGPTLPELQRELQPERAGPRCLLVPQCAAAPQAYQRGVLLNMFNIVSAKASCSTTFF